MADAQSKQAHTPRLEELRAHWGIAVDHRRRPERLAEFDRAIEALVLERQLEILATAASQIEKHASRSDIRLTEHAVYEAGGVMLLEEFAERLRAGEIDV